MGKARLARAGRGLVCWLALAGLPTAWGQGPPAAKYVIRDLGTLGFVNSGARKINERGDVIGMFTSNLTSVAFYVPANGRLINLGAVLNAEESLAFGLNEAGVAVGRLTRFSPSIRYHAFVFDPQAGATDLGASLGSFASWAFDINDSGVIVGMAQVGPGWRAFVYQSATLTALGTLGGPESAAWAVNNAGAVVGWADTAVFRPESGQYVSHAFIYADGVLQDIHGLGMESFAHDINDHGDVVGVYSIPDDDPPGFARAAAGGSGTWAFLYRDGQMQDLGAVLGDGNSAANAINNRRQVVGSFTPRTGPWRAFLYENGQVTFLNDLLPPHSGWAELHFASDINDAGHIVGTGLRGGRWHAYVLAPAQAELVALEVTQALQDWRNSVPLIAGKATFVRAHLRILDPLAPPVRGRLRAYLESGAELPGSPILPLNRNGEVVPLGDPFGARANFGSSLNFRLPDAWLSNRLVLKMEWGNSRVYNNEPAEDGGVAQDGAVSVSFQPVPAVPLKYFSVSWADTNGHSRHVTGGNYSDVRQQLDTAYPCARLDIRLASVYRWHESDGAPTNLHRLNQLLAATRKWDTLLNFAEPLLGRGDPLVDWRLYYGIVHPLMPPFTYDSAGLAENIPGRTASGYFPSEGATGYDLLIHPHEVGHLLGRHHAVNAAFYGFNADGYKTGCCGEVASPGAPDVPMYPHPRHPTPLPTLGPFPYDQTNVLYGFDTARRLPLAADHTLDLMSYGAQRLPFIFGNWPSGYTYTNLINILINRFGEGGAPAPASAQGPPRDYLMVRGEIHFPTDTVEFLPFATVTTARPVAPEPPGSYWLRLYNAANQLLNEVPFEPSRPEAEDASGPFPMGAFVLLVEQPPSLHRVEVVRNHIVLRAVSASPHPPTVTLLSPNGGETLGQGPVTFTWTARDADGDPLSYVLQYSADDGAHWETLVVDWKEPTYELAHHWLAGSGQARLRVIATDGFHSAADISDGVFTVANHRPEIYLRQPQSNEWFAAEQEVFFEARVEDVEDGELTGTNVVWHSSRDGWLGSGAILNRAAPGLSEGRHHVTVSATDSAGQTNTATVEITVLCQPPPTLAIRLETNMVVLSWAVTSASYQLQSVGVLPPADSWSTLTNTPAISEGQYRLRLPITSAARFFRLICE